MSWNYRVLAHEEYGQTFFQVHEVYYDEHFMPQTYTEKGVTVGSDNFFEIKSITLDIMESITKPILCAGKKWPEEYDYEK